jgi:hypothetical protein
MHGEDVPILTVPDVALGCGSGRDQFLARRFDILGIECEVKCQGVHVRVVGCFDLVVDVKSNMMWSPSSARNVMKFGAGP